MRHGVALLITLFFIIAITVAVGISLKNLQKSGVELHKARFLLQSSAIVEDVILLMQNVDKLGVVSDADGLNLFLLSAGFIPLELNELLVKIEITSLMGRVNLNSLGRSKELQELFREYLLRYNVQDVGYVVDLFVDCSSGNKEYYKTDIFDEIPEMYHQKIVSKRHLEKILDFYVRERHDNAVTQIPWDELVRFDEHNDTTVDANYMTPSLWQLYMPNLSEERAIELASGEIVYHTLDDIDLSKEERNDLQKYKLGFYVPVVHADIEVRENNSTAHIAFDFNINTKKGKNFEFGI